MAGSGRGGVPLAVAVALVPVLFVGVLLSIVFISDSSALASCDLTGPAVAVDPGSVPTGPIAGYAHPQLVNAAYVMLAAQQLGLSVRDQQIGVMTAMAESSLTVLSYGDTAGPDSRGLFQQRANGAWGSLADRMDPFVSSTSFFTVEMVVAGRESLDPTIVAHQVQRNADPYYYEAFWAAAGTVVQALAGVAAAPLPSGSSGSPTSSSSSGGGGGSIYNLGPVQPQTVIMANTLGPMFGISVVGGYRPPAQEQYDPNGHPAGLALDFMVGTDKAKGAALAAYAQAHASELGVAYLIWYQHIWSPQRASEGWRPMADRGSVTQNHMDHVHVSLTGDGSKSTGCHLHFEVLTDGQNVDPVAFMAGVGVAIPS